MTDFQAHLDVIWPYLRALLILIVGIIVIKVIKKYIPKLFQKVEVEPIARTLLEKIVIIVIWIVIALAIASSFGIDTGSILTLFAAAGAAIALAVQDGLSNLIGGLIVMLSGIISKGDMIKVGDAEGKVEKIDLLHTTLITTDGKIVTLPNANLMNTNIVNSSKSEARRVEINVGISYDSDSEQARYVLTQMAMEDSRVLSEPAPCCHVMEYADSSVNLQLRAWVRNEDYWDVTFYLRNNIKSVLAEAGIIIPYPHVDVHFDEPVKSKPRTH